MYRLSQPEQFEGPSPGLICVVVDAVHPMRTARLIPVRGVPQLIPRHVCHKTWIDCETSRSSVVWLLCGRKMSAEYAFKDVFKLQCVYWRGRYPSRNMWGLHDRMKPPGSMWV